MVPIDWRNPAAIKSLTNLESSDAISIPNPWPIGKKLFWHFFLLSALERHTKKIDILFNCSQFLHPIGKMNCPHIYIVHDLSYFSYPEYHKKGKKTLFRLLLKNTLSKADHIVCVSHYTHKRLIHYYPEMVHQSSVIHEAADKRFRPIANTDILRQIRIKYGLPKMFYLFVGTIEPRKNLTQLLKVYHQYKKNIPYPLYVAGGTGWHIESLHKLHRNFDLKNDVKFIGYVPDEDLPLLYNLATAFIYISKDEGFGLPPLEAMQCGTPVIVSDAGSLPEIAHKAAIVVNPNDQNAIARALQKIGEDKQLRICLRDKGLERAKEFSWEKSASELMSLFKTMV